MSCMSLIAPSDGAFLFAASLNTIIIFQFNPLTQQYFEAFSFTVAYKVYEIDISFDMQYLLVSGNSS